MCYQLKKSNTQERYEYVIKTVSLEQEKFRQIVYINECNMHENYSPHDDSLLDQNDEQDLEVKAQHGCKRYWFIAAILHAGKRQPSLGEKGTPYKQEVDLKLDTFYIFEGGKQG